ncbi:hypothetical protein EG327_010388, partial [Venturia inaequalis]
MPSVGPAKILPSINMKATFFALLLSTFAYAAPILEERQSTGTTANEYTRSGCKDIIFFFARDGIKSAFGSSRVAVEGVDYGALLSTNFNPGGSDYAGISEMKSLFQDAASKCPNSAIVAGGYSQGAALVHRAIENLSSSVKDKIVGVVTYGDTQNLQDGGQIPNFPRAKVLVICNTGDAVCAGTLTILAPHLDYVRRVPEAVSFLNGKLTAAG